MPDLLYFIWDGQYEKNPYFTFIKGKEIPCWPNAGVMLAIDGSGRSWKPEENILVRKGTVEEILNADPH